MRRTLQTSYVLISTTLLFILLAVISVTLLFLFDRSIENVRSKTLMQVSGALVKQLEKRMYSRTSYLADLLVAPLYDKNYEAIGQILEPVLEGAEVLEAVVVDANGIIVHDGEFAQLEYEEVLSNREALDTLLKNRNPYVALGNERLVVARPIMIGQEVVGAIYIEITLDTLSEDINLVESAIFTIGKDAQANFAKVITYFTFLISFIAILTSVCIARVMVRPIKKLVAQAKEIGGGNYLVEKAIDRKDELGDLANAIREMGGKLQKHNQEISFMAYNDSLTNLPNRPSFVKTLNQEIVAHERRGAFLALLFIDLDGFKNINDSYGHHAGDFLLQEVARRLELCLRVSDSISHSKTDEVYQGVTGRIGGDEFLICLPDVVAEGDVVHVAERLLSVIREPIEMGQEKLLVAASIGIAMYPKDANDGDSLIKSADVAMYQSKSRGKNTYSFSSSEMNEHVAARIVLEHDLRDAVEDIDNQFVLWIQPLINMESREMIGAEALVRWHHPVKGVILPDVFIPVAEETGMINDIGCWVLQRACFLLGQWKDLWREGDKDFSLSVNLSSRQLYSGNTLLLLSRLLKEYQLNASNIKLEVTESMLLSDAEKAAVLLQEIRELGVEVWLDDFGTGYSSLSYLSKFSVDGIKMDRCFIAGIGHDDQSEALVRSIVVLARECGLGLVAEGIETEEQAHFVRQLKCQFGQGFLYAKPMHADDFVAKYLYTRQDGERYPSG